MEGTLYKKGFQHSTDQVSSADIDFETNAANLREELEFIDEIRNEASLREVTLKQKIVARHNKKVIK